MRKTYILLLLLLGCGKNPFAPQSEIGPIIFSMRVRDYSQIHSITTDGRGLTQLTTSPSSKLGPRWSRDGKWIIFNRPSKTNIHFSSVMIADAFGRNERIVLEHGISPIFSPKANRIAFSLESLAPGFGQRDIVIYDLEKETGQWVLRDSLLDDNIADWSRDGRYLLIQSHTLNPMEPGRDIFLIDLVDSTKTRLTHQGNAWFGIFSPDGLSIAFVRRKVIDPSHIQETLHVMRIDSANSDQIVTLDNTWIISPAWSPDGLHVAFIASDFPSSSHQRICIVNLESKESKQIFEGDVHGLDWGERGQN